MPLEVCGLDVERRGPHDDGAKRDEQKRRDQLRQIEQVAQRRVAAALYLRLALSLGPTEGPLRW